MENLEKLLEMTDAEFGAIAKNGKFKSREEIDSVYKLMDIAKDVYCIWQYEDDMGGGEDEMSYAGGSYARGGRGGNRGGGRSNRGGSYRGGSYEGGSYEGGSYEGGSYEGGSMAGGSYARGRGRNARRDSMGRYSREGGYSRADGKQEYIEQMRELMMDAPDEQTRQSIQRMISEMENQ